MLVRSGMLTRPVTDEPTRTVSIVSVETGAGTSFIVTFTSANLQLGDFIRIVWDVTTNGTDSGIRNNAASPETIVAGGTVVTATAGNVSVRVIASNGVTILAQSNYSGPFIS